MLMIGAGKRKKPSYGDKAALDIGGGRPAADRYVRVASWTL